MRAALLGGQITTLGWSFERDLVAFRNVAAPGIGVALRKLERVAVDLPRVYCGMQDRFVRPFPHNPSCAVGAAVRGFLDGLGGGRRP